MELYAASLWEFRSAKAVCAQGRTLQPFQSSANITCSLFAPHPFCRSRVGAKQGHVTNDLFLYGVLQLGDSKDDESATGTDRVGPGRKRRRRRRIGGGGGGAAAAAASGEDEDSIGGGGLAGPGEGVRGRVGGGGGAKGGAGPRRRRRRRGGAGGVVLRPGKKGVRDPDAKYVSTLAEGVDLEDDYEQTVAEEGEVGVGGGGGQEGVMERGQVPLPTGASSGSSSSDDSSTSINEDDKPAAAGAVTDASRGIEAQTSSSPAAADVAAAVKAAADARAAAEAAVAAAAAAASAKGTPTSTTAQTSTTTSSSSSSGSSGGTDSSSSSGTGTTSSSSSSSSNTTTSSRSSSRAPSPWDALEGTPPLGFTISDAVAAYGKKHSIYEKNWMPFVYEDELYVVYSLSPVHKVYKLMPSGVAELKHSTELGESFWAGWWVGVGTRAD